MKTGQCLCVLVFSFCLMCLCAQAEDSPEKSAQTAAETWLGQVDVGHYAESWQAASPYVQGAVTESGWATSLQGVRTPLGNVVSRNLKSAHHTTSAPGAPDGHYVVMQFDTSFEHKQGAVETVTFMQEKDGTWKAAGYYIK
jgi:hypothetical protein